MQQMPVKPAPGRPAEAADTIRQLPLPQVAPPYDDEPGVAPADPHGDTTHEGNGWWLADAASLVPSPGRHGQPVPPQSGQEAVSANNPGGPAAGAGPSLAARAWPGRFAQVLAETLAGSRPHGQLAPWTTESVRRQIRQLGPLFATGERPLIRRVMAAAPATGVLELTAVVGLGPRVRVLALRLEREQVGSAWCCTAIESA